MAEVSSEDDLMNITPKLANMNFLKKIVLRIFREEIERSVIKSLKDMSSQNSNLEEKVDKLSKALLDLSERVDRNGKKTDILLADIDNFNANYKPDLIGYLSNFNTKWEDCVLFPNEFIFNPSTMIPFNDLEIEEGTPVYVVSLGYNFPNSNSEKQLPMVFRKTLN